MHKLKIALEIWKNCEEESRARVEVLLCFFLYCKYNGPAHPVIIDGWSWPLWGNWMLIQFEFMKRRVSSVYLKDTQPSTHVLRLPENRLVFWFILLIFQQNLSQLWQLLVSPLVKCDFGPHLNWVIKDNRALKAEVVVSLSSHLTDPPKKK